MIIRRHRWHRHTLVVHRYRRRGLIRTTALACWALLWWSLLLCWWLLVAMVWCYSMALHWLSETGLPMMLTWWSTRMSSRSSARETASSWSEPETSSDQSEGAGRHRRPEDSSASPEPVPEQAPVQNESSLTS